MAPDAHALTLEWHAPPECPGRDEVLARLQDVGATTRPLSARVRVDRAPDGWSLRLDTDDGDNVSERALRAASCAELTDAAVLLLALALDAPAAPPVVEAPTPDPAPPPAPRVTTRAQRVTSRLRFGARLEGGVAAGTLPQPAPSVSLALWIGRVGWRAELVARFLPAQTTQVTDEARVSLSAASAAARGCYALFRRPLELRACAGLEAGLMFGDAAGITHPASGVARWFGAVAGLALSWSWTRSLRVVASFDGAVTFDRPTFVIGAVGVVHRPDVLGARAALGAEFAW